jgi:hypothetical protein
MAPELFLEGEVSRSTDVSLLRLPAHPQHTQQPEFPEQKQECMEQAGGAVGWVGRHQ